MQINAFLCPFRSLFLKNLIDEGNPISGFFCRVIEEKNYFSDFRRHVKTVLKPRDIIPREARPEAERSEVTDRVVFGLITWFAGPGKSSREFVYIYIYFQGVRSLSRDISTSL